MALQTQTFQTGDYAWKSWSNGYVLALTLTEESVDTAANTSRVAYRFTLSNTDNNRFYSGTYSWDISIGGQSIAISGFTFDLSSNYITQTIASGTLTVTHGNDGTLQMPFSVSIPNVQNYNSYGPPAMTLSGTWALSEIARASQISCEDGIIGTPVRVEIHATDPSLRHTVTYSFGALTGTVAEKTELTTFTWILPDAFYSQMPYTAIEMGTLTCTTYSGGIPLSSTSCTFYAHTDVRYCAPTVSGTVTDSNPDTLALTGDASCLIPGFSTANVTVQAAAGNGATLVACTLIHNGTVYEDFPVTIEPAEQDTFLFHALDSRGLEGEATVIAPTVPYIRPTCTLSDNKPDGNGSMTVKVTGNYFAGSFGAVNNALTVQYRYKENGGSYGEWTSMQVTESAQSYTATAALTGLDYQLAYIFQARAVDCLSIVYSTEYITRAVPVFDWDENDFNVNGTLKINNKAVEDYVVSRGKSGLWTWEKWNSGLAKCWARTGARTFTFDDNHSSHYGVTPHEILYPFGWQSADYVGVNMVVTDGLAVPIVTETDNGYIRTLYARFFPGTGNLHGYYYYHIIGKWK